MMCHFGRSNATRRKVELSNALDTHDADISEAGRRYKYSKMSKSVWSFLRGTAFLYYRDMSACGLLQASDFHKEGKTDTWVMGDCHMENFGTFMDATGVVQYGINDFDEGWVGSYLFDLWRLAASVLLWMHVYGGFSSGDMKDILRSLGTAYLDMIETSTPKDFALTVANAKTPLYEVLKHAEGNGRAALLSKWTVKAGSGHRKFKDSSEWQAGKLGSVNEKIQSKLTAAIREYVHNLHFHALRDNYTYFEVLDMAEGLHTGTGSAGLRRYYALVRGARRDLDAQVILEVKQEPFPALYPYKSLEPVEKKKIDASFGSDGKHWNGQRAYLATEAMLANENPHTGYTTIDGDTFLVKEIDPHAEYVTRDAAMRNVGSLDNVVSQFAQILASSHARSDKDFNTKFVQNSFEKDLRLLINTKSKRDAFLNELIDVAMMFYHQALIDYELFCSQYSLSCRTA